ncbi:MAG: hypothetical protein AAFV90_26515 [Cyanobacteria bacterium J06634_5]
MTFHNPQEKTAAFLSHNFSKLSTHLKRIDRKQIQHYAYNIALALGVLLYCAFLVVRGALRLSKKARGLWLHHKVTPKLKAAYKTIHTDWQPAALTDRVIEVKKAYSALTVHAIALAEDLQASYHSICNEFAGTQTDVANNQLLQTKGKQ